MPARAEVGAPTPQLFRSTRGEVIGTSLRDMVLQGQAPDGGLYLPETLTKMSPDFFRRLPGMSLQEIGFEVSKHLYGSAIPDQDLRGIVERAFNFDIELQKLGKKTHLLELFHGPTAAFKDFGARYMAQLLSYELEHGNGDHRPLTIIVATSGDTGSAVADAFLNLPGIRVTILYPKGKVSKLQEKQLTTYGEDSNIWTLEVDGTFDDCQALATQAFNDQDLKKPLRLNSANSKNGARLIPQSFYDFWAFGELRREGYDDKVVLSVPSGNFGNLTAGIIAKRLGLPIQRFVAATNANHVVPDYLNSGIWTPREFVGTISPSMDVSDPSNFERLDVLYKGDVDKMREDIYGTHFSDDEVREKIKEVWEHFGYLMDPHSAIAFMGWREFKENTGFDGDGVVLMTAHSAKFPDTVQPLIGDYKIPTPRGIKEVAKKKKESTPISTSYEEFKQFLLDNKDRN